MEEQSESVEDDLSLPDESTLMPGPGYYAKKIENEVSLMALEVERHCLDHHQGEPYNPYSPRHFRFQWAVDAYLKLAHLSAGYYGAFQAPMIVPDHPGLAGTVSIVHADGVGSEEYDEDEEPY